MPKKHDTQAIREIVGALDFQHVAVKEIARRLAKAECGLPYPVVISERQVRNYRAAYRKDHGMPPPTEPDGSQRVETIDAVLNRLVRLLGSEITAFEGMKRGSMTRERLALLDKMHNALRRWQRAQGTATGRLKTSQVGPSERPQAAAAKPAESELQRLARIERERKAEPGHVSPEATAQRLAAEIGQKIDGADQDAA